MPTPAPPPPAVPHIPTTGLLLFSGLRRLIFLLITSLPFLHHYPTGALLPLPLLPPPLNGNEGISCEDERKSNQEKKGQGESKGEDRGSGRENKIPGKERTEKW